MRSAVPSCKQVKFHKWIETERKKARNSNALLLVFDESIYLRFIEIDSTECGSKKSAKKSALWFANTSRIHKQCVEKVYPFNLKYAHQNSRKKEGKNANNQNDWAEVSENKRWWRTKNQGKNATNFIDLYFVSLLCLCVRLCSVSFQYQNHGTCIR